MKTRALACASLMTFAVVHGAFALTENFDTGKAADWTEIQGEWAVSKGMYTQDDTIWTTTATHETYHRSYFGEESWDDYTVEATVRIDEGGDLAPIIGIFFRVTEKSDIGDYYYFRLDERASEGPGLIKAPNVTMQINGAQPAEIGRDYVLKVEVEGNDIRCYVDGVLEIEVSDDAFPTGAIGVGTFNAVGHFDDVSVNGDGIPRPVAPRGKLATVWGGLRRAY
ncbi:MAG: family 16 glycoside hydrolase [Candidatus Poribacteria bacterium]